MGLFDKILKGNSEPEKFTNEEALTGIIVAITGADGNISDDEIADLNSIIAKSKTLQHVNGNEYTRMVDKIFRVYRRDGVQQLLSLSIQGLSSNIYEGAFAVVCDLAYSDGYIENAEKAMLEKIQQGFGIDDQRALSIIEVIMTKNQV